MIKVERNECLAALLAWFTSYLDRGCRLDLKEVLRGNGGLMQLGKHLMRRKLLSVWVQGSWQGFLYLFGK